MAERTVCVQRPLVSMDDGHPARWCRCGTAGTAETAGRKQRTRGTWYHLRKSLRVSDVTSSSPSCSGAGRAVSRVVGADSHARAPPHTLARPRARRRVHLVVVAQQLRREPPPLGGLQGRAVVKLPPHPVGQLKHLWQRPARGGGGQGGAGQRPGPPRNTRAEGGRGGSMGRRRTG